ncbi:MAG: neutral/alkaline non-lysosomal ceramidase N-terminal domain-containing protein, partial [Deltaproteobacteria bacterium]|nr:neutral/alkaline non-lysosomal ceramidase N-terminal domain-containing protein [Deltaproteobacteria bacterium]
MWENRKSPRQRVFFYAPKAVSVIVLIAWASACPGGPAHDAGVGDTGTGDAVDAESHDGGPPVPPPVDHCRYERLPPIARSGGEVRPGKLQAGVAEAFLSGPISAALGAYTARAQSFGNQGFIDARREPIAGAFSTSVGVETRPRVRALVLTTGEDTAEPDDDEKVALVKVDLGVSYQGLVHESERILGPEWVGKIIIAASHSHSAWANFHGHGALQVGFSNFRRLVFDRIVQEIVQVIRKAFEKRRPARIGFAYGPNFDPEDRVSRDRRPENDWLAGGKLKAHRLYVIRVDTAEGEPMALLPVFGVHPILLGANNVIASGDVSAGIERVLEERFERSPDSPLGPVLVAHLQGAGGDVSPAGRNTTECPPREMAPLCQDFAKAETVGRAAEEAILQLHARAGMVMADRVAIEALGSSFERGPNWENFTVRNGRLRYAPFDGVRPADRLVWTDSTRSGLLSPIDEFNAPFGAALCGNGARTSFFGARGATQLPNTANMDESYAGCNQLIPRFLRIFESALEIQVGPPPICD